MTTPCESGSDLESCLRRRLTELFGRVMPQLVVGTIAHELAETTAAWLRSRARAETFDSQSEGVLLQAADDAWTRRPFLSA